MLHVLTLVFVLIGATLTQPASAFEAPPRLTEADFRTADPALAEIGRLLFFDKILSGNRNIACSTCHNPDFGTSDGVSLGIGEGGNGLGPDRTPGEGAARIRKRIPRNAPALWNLGAREVETLFHDGRVSVSDLYGNGFNTPAQEWLPDGLDDVLAAQALFPLTSQFEMAGDPRENEIAGAAYRRIDAVWPIVAARVRAIPEYAEMFARAMPDKADPASISIVDIANAIAAFENLEFRSFDSPFDDWLSGDTAALSPSQLRGADLFYGRAGCSACHSEPLLTDHDFHALALPQFGPGRTRPFDPIARDTGRIAVSDRREDAYRFRTPSLRNVALTAPYGHDGAYATLDGIVRHHLDPLAGFKSWRPDMARLPSVPWLAAVDFLARDDRAELERVAARIDIQPVALTDEEIGDIVAFLGALTGRASVKGRMGAPKTVPSGLEVDR